MKVQKQWHYRNHNYENNDNNKINNGIIIMILPTATHETTKNGIIAIAIMTTTITVKTEIDKTD